MREREEEKKEKEDVYKRDIRPVYSLRLTTFSDVFREREIEMFDRLHSPGNNPKSIKGRY